MDEPSCDGPLGNLAGPPWPAETSMFEILISIYTSTPNFAQVCVLSDIFLMHLPWCDLRRKLRENRNIEAPAAGRTRWVVKRLSKFDVKAGPRRVAQTAAPELTALLYKPLRGAPYDWGRIMNMSETNGSRIGLVGCCARHSCMAPPRADPECASTSHAPFRDCA